MDAKELKYALLEKMEAEQKQYRNDLLSRTPEEILGSAYEYTARQDILRGMDLVNLSMPQAGALLDSPSPLADICENFRDAKEHMKSILECIKAQADTLLCAKQEATRYLPLYQQSGEYAREHGELDAFRASRQANVACKEAIEAAIRSGFDGMYLTADVKGVLAEFGPERVTYVLAATIQSKDWDERFSHDNKAWAAAVPMFEAEHRRCAYVVHSHSTVVNGFVGMVRKELDAVREQPEKKPSIKEQLASKSIPGEQLIKPKDRGPR